MAHISTHPHEVEGHLLYTASDTDRFDGLDPYWLLSSMLINDFDGYSRKLETEIVGQTWEIELTYYQSGIAPRPSDSVDERLLGFTVRGSGPGEAKATFQIEPRFPDMRHYESGDELNIPWNITDANGNTKTGIDADFHGSNIEPEAYPLLLRRFVEELGAAAGRSIRSGYFENPHSQSNLYTYERYVRIKKACSDEIVRSSGLFMRVIHLLTNEKGVKWEFLGDNEDVVGKMHKLRLEPAAARKLVPIHEFGKQLKHYHMKNPDAQQGPTEHPKFGVLVTKRLNGNEAIAWDRHEEMKREIEETIINTLEWAGLDTDPSSGAFVEDKHFAVVESDVEISRFEDPTPELEAEQDHLIMRVLSDLTTSADQVAKTLATDGGDGVHYGDLAEETGYSVSQIYRAIEELGDLVTSDNGLVTFSSKKIRQEVAALVDGFETELKSTADRLAHLCNVDLRGAADSALDLWMSNYGVEFVEAANDLEGTVRIDTLLTELRSRSKLTNQELLEEALRRGEEAWESAGRDWKRFRQLRFRATVDGEERVDTIGKILG
ncbi:DUF7845 domain-containing protein [Halalkalirubrum salinum]|uniref:DUF7845 domain-containing protein n=1 Tax=Halalkalirubrum salinum TaxID=2563889 RepID=UPI0010FB69F8|nr:hypothetical protein [Halalkalirubrum salinum]